MSIVLNLLRLSANQALYRPTEVSLQFIRWLRVSLMRPTCYAIANGIIESSVQVTIL